MDEKKEVTHQQKIEKQEHQKENDLEAKINER